MISREQAIHPVARTTKGQTGGDSRGFATVCVEVESFGKDEWVRVSTNLRDAKSKSIIGFNALCNWVSDVINRTTGYDQITDIEKQVNESERRFENTTKQLRELNTEYMVSLDVQFDKEP